MGVQPCMGLIPIKKKKNTDALQFRNFRAAAQSQPSFSIQLAKWNITANHRKCTTEIQTLIHAFEDKGFSFHQLIFAFSYR